MVIEILDHVAQACTADDGKVVHDLIVPALDRGDVVTVSFKGIDAVPSSFVNAAFIELLERFDFPFIRDHLKIVNSSRQINRLIKERFGFEVERYERSRAVG
jgi:hypothetical protein